MAFIIAMATKMVISGGDDDLVEKDYYEKGLAYDVNYNMQQEAIRDSVIPDFAINQSGLTISFTSAAKYKLVCKRPSDSKLDRIFESLATEEKSLFIPREQLRSGPWNMHLEFSIGDNKYLVKREMVMP